MTEYKRLIFGIGCKEGKAVHLADEQEAAGFSIMEFGKSCSDNGADGLLLFDCAQNEQDHEKTIGLLKEVARESDTPIITGGQVNRLEDVKKYLYAGASAVFLNVSMEENVDLMKEAASRFGSEKIYAYLPDAQYLSRVEEYQQLGASVMILDKKEAISSRFHELREVPFLLIGKDEKDLEMLAAPNIRGMILDVAFPSRCMEIKQQLKQQGIPVETFESSIRWSEFKLDQNGLIPVIVQDYKTNEVLMMAYMNEEAFQKTLESGRMTYFSRSRQTLWLKGETSGHFQYVRSLMLDCDQDTILAKVHQVGAACHTGNRTCFYQTLAARTAKESNPLKVFEEEYAVIQDRKEHPKEGSYTNYLFDKGLDKILKKCGEEATEIIIAAKNPDPEEIKYEISDFLYHVMVLMVEKGITWEEITREIANR